MKDELIQITADYLGKDPSEITSDQTFKDMGLDSLDLLDMVMEVEQKFGVKLTLTQDVDTIDKLAALLEEMKK